MKNRPEMTIAAVALVAGMAAPTFAQNQVPLIPRDVLFSHPTRANPRISPDGMTFSFLAPLDGVLNIWIAPLGDPDLARAVTEDRHNGIRVYQWAHTNKHILYLQDPDGDGNAQLMCVDTSTGLRTPLSPATAAETGSQHAVSARIQHISHRYPSDIVVGLNIRDRDWHDLYVVNIETGERVELQRNEGFASMWTDDDYSVRLVTRQLPDGSQELLVMNEEAQWAPFTTIPAEDVLHSGIVGFDKSGDEVFMIDSRGRDTSALKTINLTTGAAQTLVKDRDADVSGGVLIHPTERHIQAASTTYLRREWHIVDKQVKGDFKYLKTVADGEISVLSRSSDDKHWIVAFELDNGPVQYYRYDRSTETAHLMFTNRPDLEGLTLARMHAETVKTRDRQTLVAYYSLPPNSDPRGRGRPRNPLPTVVWVHGGPWWRDTWGFDPIHQWLANRGYAVISVNYRGSTGFGKKFMNAGNGEWGGKMQNDLTDTVAWAVKKKITDEDSVAIMGGSYGGYAALMGLCFTPDKFECGINIGGPVDLVSFVESMPGTEFWTARVGDHRTEDGRTMLRDRSPVTCAVDITKPLLMTSGIQDPRVSVTDAQLVVDTLQQKGIPVTWLVYPDEGHGLARAENRMAFFAVAESFLADHLDGRAQPIGTDLDGSSVEIPVGGDSLAAAGP